MSEEIKYLEHNYETSKDYELLYELIKTQRVVCFVQCKDYKVKDIAQSSAIFREEHINIGARGIGYVSAFDFEDKTIKEDFIEQCNFYDLEFIEPNKKEKQISKYPHELTVGELKKKLERYSDDDKVFIERITDVYFDKHNWKKDTVVWQKDEEGNPIETTEYTRASGIASTKNEENGKDVIITAHY